MGGTPTYSDTTDAPPGTSAAVAELVGGPRAQGQRAGMVSMRLSGQPPASTLSIKGIEAALLAHDARYHVAEERRLRRQILRGPSDLAGRSNGSRTPPRDVVQGRSRQYPSDRAPARRRAERAPRRFGLALRPSGAGSRATTVNPAPRRRFEPHQRQRGAARASPPLSASSGRARAQAWGVGVDGEDAVADRHARRATDRSSSGAARGFPANNDLEMQRLAANGRSRAPPAPS